MSRAREMTRGARWVARGAVMAALVALAGCNDEPPKPAGKADPCLPVPWDAWVPTYDDGGQAVPPEIGCFTTDECPPPLVCQVPSDRESEGLPGRCDLSTATVSPQAAIEHFGVAEFVAAVDQAGAGADYTTVSFSQLPADAAFVRCAIYSCPIDESVITSHPTRCLIDETVISLATTSSLTLPVASGVSGTPALALSATPGCAVPSCEGACETRPLPLPAVGFYGYCLAFSETALVGATALINLDVDEIGAAGEVAYARMCSRNAVSYAGAACLYENGPSGNTLGVCTAPMGRCCPACWSQAQCQNMGGTRCVLVDATSDGDGGLPLTPFVGYCEGRCEASGTRVRDADVGDDAGRDGGMGGGGRDGGMGGAGRDGGLP